MVSENLDFDADAAPMEMLIAATKAMHGYVYYEAKLTRTRLPDGSWKERIDVYEKHRKPDVKFAHVLETLGVDAAMHRDQKEG
jgi:hypothetical protein